METQQLRPNSVIDLKIYTQLRKYNMMLLLLLLLWRNLSVVYFCRCEFCDEKIGQRGNSYRRVEEGRRLLHLDVEFLFQESIDQVYPRGGVRWNHAGRQESPLDDIDRGK